MTASLRRGAALPISNVEVSELLQRSSIVMARWNVEEREELRPAPPRGCTCDLQWRWQSEQGEACCQSASATSIGKKAARALARERMLELLGLDFAVSDEDRWALAKLALDLDDPVSTAQVDSVVQFLRATEPPAWRTVLPSVWRRVLASYSLEHVQSLVDAITGPPLPLDLYEQLLDDCCVLNNCRFGQSVLAMLTACPSSSEVASAMRAGKLEALTNAPFSLQLHPSCFTCQRALKFYQFYRGMLAMEFRAEVTANIAACRTVERGDGPLEPLVATCEDGTSAYSVFLQAVGVSGGCRALIARMVCVMDAASERFLQLSGMRGDEDYALLRPLLEDDRLSWSQATVVRVTSLTAKPGEPVEWSLRVITDEHRGCCFEQGNFELFALPTSVSYSRSLTALRALCVSRLGINQKPSTFYISPALRYILLYPELAHEVVAGAAVPADFLECLGSSKFPPPLEKRQQRDSYEDYGSGQPFPADSYKLTDPELHRLTPAQRRAVISALEQRLSIIQGPPGTGKTFVACRIVAMWCKAAPNHKILVVADSNVAADNLSEGLRAIGIRSIRVGAGSSDDDLVHVSTPSPAATNDFGYEFTKQRAVKYERYRQCRSRIAQHNVIITTCIGCGHSMFDALRFERVLVDECGQSIEPASLVPIARRAQRLVLLGDHKQLPPTILSREALAQGLGLSLLERLVAVSETACRSSFAKVVLLDIQCRMHHSLAEFPSYEFYDGKVRTAAGIDERSCPAIPGFVFPNPALRVAFIDLRPRKSGSGFDFTDGASKANRNEALLVPRLVKALTFDAVHPRAVGFRDIGIITPYAAQKRLIMKILAATFPSGAANDLEIGSVDGFQGREKDLIIFSAVRSNASRDVGFLADSRRMNVAITRAKRGLIIIGDGDTLASNRTWERWLHWAKSRHGCICAEQVSSYLGLTHPDIARAESYAQAYLDGRVKDLWPHLRSQPANQSTVQMMLPTAQAEDCFLASDAEDVTRAATAVASAPAAVVRRSEVDDEEEQEWWS